MEYNRKILNRKIYSETKNVPLNKPWVKEDTKSEMRKYFEMNENINTSKFS